MRSRLIARGMLGGLILAALAPAPPIPIHHVSAAPPSAAASGVAATRSQAINDALGLKRSRLVQLSLPARADRAVRLAVPSDDGRLELELVPHSIRSPGYRLLVQVDGGPLVETLPGEERTFRGRVAGVEGSRVSASLLDDGLHALIDLGDGRQHWLEPTARHLPPGVGAAGAEHVLYASTDVNPCGGLCGMPDKVAADLHLPFDAVAPSRSASGGGGTPCIAELACDADVEYFEDQGGSVPATEAFITNIINNVNIQYERDVELTHVITTIVVRTGNRNSDPYTTNSPEALLCEFITEWTSNQAGIARDVAQLFTGRTIQAGTIGIAADIGDIGNNEGSCTCHPLFGTDGSYCLVQGIGGGDSCRADLSAHELGHLWGAVHCACSSPPFTMNPGIVCANVFSPGSIGLISAFKSSRTTLDGPCAGAPVTNDVCAGAVNITETSALFTTIGVGTECPSLPIACDEGAGDNLEFLWDIWYRYTASCTGDATVSLCAASYDARLVVYADNSCPPADGDLVACDDDFCGLGAGSQVTFPVAAGESFLIRVGGFAAFGSGTLNVACSGVSPCPADTDGDTVVDVTDLLALLAAWGACAPPCPPDIDDSGVVDVTDLLALLAAWGACP